MEHNIEDIIAEYNYILWYDYMQAVKISREEIDKDIIYTKKKYKHIEDFNMEDLYV